MIPDYSEDEPLEPEPGWRNRPARRAGSKQAGSAWNKPERRWPTPSSAATERPTRNINQGEAHDHQKARIRYRRSRPDGL